MNLREHLTMLAKEIYDGLSAEQKAFIESDVPVTFSSTNTPKIMVIDCSPGDTEIKTGFPLVGASGMIFRHAAIMAGISDYIYCTNIVPFKSIGNKVFPQDIIDAFRPWLGYQIQALKPVVILTLGKEALSWFKYENEFNNLIDNVVHLKNASYLDIPIVPAFSPSYFYRIGVMHHMVNAKEIKNIKLSQDDKIKFNDFFIEPIMRLSTYLKEL